MGLVLRGKVAINVGIETLNLDHHHLVCLLRLLVRLQLALDHLRMSVVH